MNTSKVVSEPGQGRSGYLCCCCGGSSSDDDYRDITGAKNEAKSDTNYKTKNAGIQVLQSPSLGISNQAKKVLPERVKGLKIDTTRDSTLPGFGDASSPEATSPAVRSNSNTVTSSRASINQ
jgi:hypothetical protein